MQKLNFRLKRLFWESWDLGGYRQGPRGPAAIATDQGAQRLPPGTKGPEPGLGRTGLGQKNPPELVRVELGQAKTILKIPVWAGSCTSLLIFFVGIPHRRIVISGQGIDLYRSRVLQISSVFWRALSLLPPWIPKT